MSLRDFNSSSDDRPIILNTEPLGNGSGLGTFHTVSPEEREPDKTPKIVGALAVALMVGAGGIYAYTMTGKHPAPIQTAALPSNPAPVPQPAAMTAPVQDTAAPATAPMPDAAPAPVKNAEAKPTRTHLARETAQPQAMIPEPVSPKAPASDVAANSPQAQAVPQSMTTPTNDNVASNTVQAPQVQAPQETQSSTPQADNTAPAQDQQTGATPAPQPAAPAQSSGQVQQ